MAERAKLFQNGGSQAVRLPKSCRFTGQGELVVRRVWRKVILEPADDWSPEFLACLGAWNEEIPRSQSQSIATRKNPLEGR
jgi:antitoxin VapB